MDGCKDGRTVGRTDEPVFFILVNSLFLSVAWDKEIPNLNLYPQNEQDQNIWYIGHKVSNTPYDVSRKPLSREVSRVWHTVITCATCPLKPHLSFLLRYARDWRYHKDERLWLTRAPGVEPQLKTSSYERGTYYFFDCSTWRKVAKEFHLEYDKLEDKPTLQSVSAQ